MTQLLIPDCFLPRLPAAHSAATSPAPAPAAMPEPPPVVSTVPAASRRARPARAWATCMRLRGPAVLDDATLLALIDGGGRDSGAGRRRAQRILAEAGSAHGLGQLGFAALRGLGLGARGATRLLAALELGRRATCRPAPTHAVTAPAAAHALLAPLLAHAPRERFVVVVLDARQRPLHVEQIGEGGLQLCPVDLRAVFGTGLRAGGAAILVGHNHPSGELVPSAADVRLTARLVEAGTLLGMPLVDHLIVHGERYVSMASLGLLGPDVPLARMAAAAADRVDDSVGAIGGGDGGDALASVSGGPGAPDADGPIASASVEVEPSMRGRAGATPPGGAPSPAPLPRIWRQWAAGR